MEINFMKMCAGVMWENIKYFDEVQSFVAWDLAHTGIRMLMDK